jgi:sortase (surface protein transpeptidase)
MKKRGVVLLITAVAAIVFFGTRTQALWYAPGSDLQVPSQETVPRTLPPAEEPVTLRIPKLNIDTKIQQTGLNSKGNMGVPTNYTDVAWYKHGTIPGQVGSAVIDGHVDNGLGLAGVFKHLGELRKGDDVYVITKTGRELHFVVEEAVAYPYKSVPLEKLFTRTGDAWLNLITCGGTWVKAEKTYDERFVVYTRLVSS